MRIVLFFESKFCNKFAIHDQRPTNLAISAEETNTVCYNLPSTFNKLSIHVTKKNVNEVHRKCCTELTFPRTNFHNSIHTDAIPKHITSNESSYHPVKKTLMHLIFTKLTKMY